MGKMMPAFSSRGLVRIHSRDLWAPSTRVLGASLDWEAFAPHWFLSGVIGIPGLWAHSYGLGDVRTSTLRRMNLPSLHVFQSHQDISPSSKYTSHFQVLSLCTNVSFYWVLQFCLHWIKGKHVHFLFRHQTPILINLNTRWELGWVLMQASPLGSTQGESQIKLQKTAIKVDEKYRKMTSIYCYTLW